MEGFKELATYLADTKEIFNTERELGRGGEGAIFTVHNHPNKVAKIYFTEKRTPEQEVKLKLMVSNPPQDDTRQLPQPHISISWPEEILYENGSFVGFTMPLIPKSTAIFEIFNPKLRLDLYPDFDVRYLYRTAKNLAIAMNALHARGYVIGDVNQKNILVASNALISLIDTDSFQVVDRKNNVTYRCPVGVDEYTPPELQGTKLDTIDRNPEHDCFGLAVMIFQILMEGYHPFTGVPPNPGQSTIGGQSTFLQCIKQGIFPYYGNNLYQPPPGAPEFDILSPEVQSLFIKCFISGHIDPAVRPKPWDWLSVLDKAEEALIQCQVNSGHYYSSHQSRCPWCEREKKRIPIQQSLPPVFRHNQFQAAPSALQPQLTPVYPTSRQVQNLPASQISTKTPPKKNRKLIIGLIGLFLSFWICRFAWPTLATFSPFWKGGGSAYASLPTQSSFSSNQNNPVLVNSSDPSKTAIPTPTSTLDPILVSLTPIWKNDNLQFTIQLVSGPYEINEGIKIQFKNLQSSEQIIRLFTSDVILKDDLGNLYPLWSPSEVMEKTLSAAGEGGDTQEVIVFFENFIPPEAKAMDVSIKQINDIKDLVFTIPLLDDANKIDAAVSVVNDNSDYLSLKATYTNNSLYDYVLRFNLSDFSLIDDLGNEYSLLDPKLAHQYQCFLQPSTSKDYSFAYVPAIDPKASQLTANLKLMGNTLTKTFDLGEADQNIRFEAQIRGINTNNFVINLKVANLGQSDFIMRFSIPLTYVQDSAGQQYTNENTNKDREVRTLKPGDTYSNQLSYKGLVNKDSVLELIIPLMSGEENIRIPVQSQ